MCVFLMFRYVACFFALRVHLCFLILPEIVRNRFEEEDEDDEGAGEEEASVVLNSDD